MIIIASFLNTIVLYKLAFKPYENKGIDLFKYKLMYLGIYGFVLSIGLYKFYNLGLLPLSPSDWVDIIPGHEVKHFLI